MRKHIAFISGFGLVLVFLIFLISGEVVPNEVTENRSAPVTQISPAQSKAELPLSKTLLNDYHIYQSFNNCGPASLSMALSYYDIHVSQEELGAELRPYQNPQGDNDDKSVTLEELGEKAKDYNLLPYHRPSGNITILKQFIAQDIPIVTRTWLAVDDDIGHYRVVKGYDDESQEIIQDDSYQGDNLRFSYDEFNQLWSKFNYEYLVLVSEDKKEIAEQILGDQVNEQVAWQYAKENAEQELQSNPDDITSRFNLAVAYYHLGQYEESIREYETVANQLPFRTLWYQIEPVQAYYELGRDDMVFEITDAILTNQNRAYSELYVIRGNSYKRQGKIEAARQEYEKAVFYNTNLHTAKTALRALADEHEEL